MITLITLITLTTLTTLAYLNQKTMHMSRTLFIGLGNPGDQYDRTRHNAGWLAVDWLLQLWSDDSIPPRWTYEKKIQAAVCKLTTKWGQRPRECIFIKPHTFMNESGQSVLAAVKWFLNRDPHDETNTTPLATPSSPSRYQFPEVVVLHDDLDLEIGRYKLQFDSGPKIHNGVNSVRRALDTNAFWTARLGIDDRAGARTIPGKAYVLQRLSADNERLIQQAVQTLAEEIPYVIA